MTAASIGIREAGLEDLDVLVPLFEGYRAFYGQKADPERSRAFLHARLQQHQAHILLAELESETHGFALLYPLFSSLRCGPLWQLNDLFVAHGVRQHGLGKALLQACESFARSRGALGLQLETQRTNTVAQALYTELGWEADDEFCTYHLPLAGP